MDLRLSFKGPRTERRRCIHSFDGARKNKPDHLFEAARFEADEAAWELVYSTMSRRYALLAAAEAARLRKESFDRQAKFSLAEIGFRGEREQAARDTLWEKVYQAQAADGLLNYNQRIAAAEARFAADFRDVLALLTSAQRGLKDVYGYAAEFPKEGSAGYFEAVSQWTRTASSWRTTFAQQDQTYVLALSVKDLAKSQWEAALATPEWSFEISEDLFPGQSHVRLRGVSVAVAIAPPEPPPSKGAAAKPPDTPTPEGYWSARVSPTAALPTCFLGRVTDWNSPRDPEIAGASVLHNASPLGKWKLSLSPKSTSGIPAARLQDVTLYLHVAVRSRKA